MFGKTNATRLAGRRKLKQKLEERRARNTSFVRQQLKLPSGITLTLCKPKLDDLPEEASQ
jgi:hypothetical protein